MSNATRVLQVASREVGYSRWNDPLTGTKYGRWYAGLGKGSYYAANGVPYCAMFASWVFAQAGAKCVGLPEAYCPYIVNAAKNAGKWVGRNALKPGDLILFSWAGNGVADHVGIVEKVFSGYVQTIEGNTSSASNANGGLVARRTRSLDYTVLGGVRPAWGTTASTGGSASAGGVVAVDGIWGSATTRALQKINRTPQDGVISSQDVYWKSRNPGLGSGWEWVSNATGSQLIMKLQKAFGVPQDGLIGPATIKGLQRYYGTPQDGVISDQSQAVMAMQRAINKQLGGKK